MKKIINTLAFILIIGFVGAWECGNYDFRTLLFNVGVTLSFLLVVHIMRFCFQLLKIIRKSKKHKIKHVKIS